MYAIEHPCTCKQRILVPVLLKEFLKDWLLTKYQDICGNKKLQVLPLHILSTCISLPDSKIACSILFLFVLYIK